MAKELKDYLYYEEENPSLKIYCGDCLDIMPLLPKVDLVVTDPPYGIDMASRGTLGSNNCGIVKDYGSADWDKNIPEKEVFNMMIDKSKDQIIFGGNFFVEHLKNSSCWLVWDKDNTGRYADCELAYTSFKSAVRKFRYRWNGMLQEHMNDKEYRWHPTQKPVPVIKWAIQQCKYWDTPLSILDPFMGSGTTLVAAKELKKNCIGIEINEKYCEIAKKRLMNTQVPFI